MRKAVALVVGIGLGLALAIGPAEEGRAFWGWGGCGGWWCGPRWDGGCWYLGIRPGPIRRLLFGPYRWYWVPTHCLWTISSCCLADCCCGGECPVVHEHPKPPAPRQQPTAAPVDQPPKEGEVPTPQAPPGAQQESAPAGIMPLPMPATPQANARGGQGRGGVASRVNTRTGTAEIRLVVPWEARVIINGHRTRSAGPVRRYVSLGLEPGKVYRYTIRVELSDKDRSVFQEQDVWLAAGQAVELAVRLTPSDKGLLASMRQ
ncbi:MAG: TIGR03000 domain-containing protein [Thermoguttaceae bacterium]|nr:TIGR03000 domain-containing protein [Thermoguttaceae bacterium]MDW8078823.1 TIGR03000 domain-containing protein [Thermoguttaceae bacterium]